MSEVPHTLVLVAHPDLRHSRVNRALLNALNQETAARDGHLVVCDLYALYPDYAIDVAAEQSHAARADLIVWLHPIHWYAMPALMKLWVDEVLTLGWAYGQGTRALRGKHLWLVASTGGSEAAYHPSGYNRYFFDAFLPPYEQTAALCGLRWLPPLVQHGAHAIDDDALTQHVQTVLQALRTYPAWPEMDAEASCPDCDLPDTDRPTPEA